MPKIEAVYLLNSYIKADAVMQSLLGATFNIFPLYADEPSGTPSYPYIRYLSIPVIGSDNWRIRRDVVQYTVGEKDYDKLSKILERLIDILNIDDSDHTKLPIKDSRYKIMHITATGGSFPQTPDQENGVYERGINVQIAYTKLSATTA